MGVCTRGFGSSSFLAILGVALAACTVQTKTTDPVTGDPETVNAQVSSITVVGTAVTGALYLTGDIGLTTLPQNAAGEAVLSNALHVGIKLTTPAALDIEVTATECTVPDATKKSVSIGVILDDSGSMEHSDPELHRKAATVSFLNTLGADDKVLLTDYGQSGDDLRDLLCVLNGGASCSPPTAAFSSDKAQLIRAAEGIAPRGGTPLYGACAQMVALTDTVKDQRRGMLLLSDGQPTDEELRASCINAAKAVQIPVYTVGLGPAAEGDPSVEADAVKVLRELATETGGSYASANQATDLDRLFQNVGGALAKGSCRTTAKVKNFSKILPGTKITGEVAIGDKGARATFEFVAPTK